MPIALDTNQTHRFVFETDRDKSPEVRPALIFRFPTCRQIHVIADLFDGAKSKKSVGEQLESRLDAVRVLLCGWENMNGPDDEPIAYDAARLGDVISDLDIEELRGRLLMELSAGELEKKLSALRSRSKLADSAKAATAESAEGQPEMPL